MEFRDKQSIYLQIAEYVCDQILLNKWIPGQRIHSIRELAVKMEVTPNTVQNAYNFLQQKQIITNKRGVGYFVEAQGNERVLEFRREQFLQNELPLLCRNMFLLGITAEEFTIRFNEFIKQNF